MDTAHPNRLGIGFGMGIGMEQAERNHKKQDRRHEPDIAWTSCLSEHRVVRTSRCPNIANEKSFVRLSKRDENRKGGQKMKRGLTLLCLVLALSLSVFSCDIFFPDDDDDDDDDKYTLTITDTAVVYPSGQYWAGVFSGTTYKSDLSISAKALENGNSVAVENLEGDTMYDVFIWIDSNGGGDSFDLGVYYSITSISADVGVEYNNAFSSFSNKEVTVNAASSIASETVHCIWLVAGSLDSEVSRGELYSQASREQVNHLVGFASETFPSGGALSVTVQSSDYSFPLHTTIGDLQYDLICIIDTNDDGIRNAGDWEGEHFGEAGDTSSVSITINQL